MTAPVLPEPTPKPTIDPLGPKESAEQVNAWIDAREKENRRRRNNSRATRRRRRNA